MTEKASAQENNNFAFDSLQAIRNRLLDLTARNRLLNFKHGKTGFIRVIDELPNQLSKMILDGNEVTFIPVDEPTRKELIKYGYLIIDEEGQDVKAKADPSAKEWAKIKGFNTNFELSASRGLDPNVAKHNDSDIQSLLYPRELEAQLRNIRSKANTAIEETGSNVLYLAFGFLEWFEDEKSDVTRQAPLYLIPVKIDRASLNKNSGTYTYTIEYTSEDIISNLSLREKLKHDFHLELPELTEDILPEEYLEAVSSQLIRHKPQWKIKRFTTLAMFDFGKLLMYLDLDPARWPKGSGNIQNHKILQKFFAKEGREHDDVSTSFDHEYEIDALDNVHELYPLIDDADSSQHSALVDAIKGKNLVIEGPPGSGKSQTITNLIAAAIAQGKKVLFVAEKMAALQVVKSRLNKAGLGDFCLELHSHKTQKKQVYENIAHRMHMQDKYRYPKSIEIDLQMYEEKKLALTRYANLINSNWKNTGRTIHQIFSTATRYREEFVNISLENIKPDNISGQTFDEISSRRNIDELKRYADVFKEVKMQLGLDSKLSEHPWFGVYNKSIQLFDSDDVCKLLQQWNTEIQALLSVLAPLNSKFNEESINELELLELFLSDAENIPELRGVENFEALTLLDNTTRGVLSEYLDLYKQATYDFNELKKYFEVIVLSDSDDFKSLCVSNANLQSKIKNHDLSLTNIYQQVQLLVSLQDLTTSIIDDLVTTQQQVPSIELLLAPTVDGFNELMGFCKHIAALDNPFVNRRDELFDNELLDKHLPTLEELLGKIKPLHKKLIDTFKLDELSAASELKEIHNIFSNSGIFGCFSSDWRAAKHKLLVQAKGLKPKLKQLKPLIPDLIEYQIALELLQKEPAYQTLLQHEYKGIDTPIEDILCIRDWYKNVRKSYGIGFGKKVALATSLFSIDNDIFKGLEHLATTKTLSEIEKFNELYPQLSLVFNHDVFSNKRSDLTRHDGMQLFIEQLLEELRNTQTVCKNEFTLTKLNFSINQIIALFEIEVKISDITISREIFGENSILSIRSDSDYFFTILESTLSLSLAISMLHSTQLKNYLITNISQETCQFVKAIIAEIKIVFQRYQTLFNKFSEKVELDHKAWFITCDGTFESYLVRNEKAISQPRWLSTWVDFIRIRTSLSEKGLEKFLRYTETGELDLDNIEQVYIYSVFDILAREIISENKELAYFSGADQNAIRKQFSEYDNKLKKLQQEKIAHQVAKSGYSKTTGGVASGRVSSYSEMGLINNEINKKTRHVPIRQLLKRSGRSLSALKPCFMMGPHSVAQYLQPGQIEFDIVIMDEASQIKPEDALGTIARGKQLVVVGDPKQLPPTSFFDKVVQSEDDDTTAIEQSESILDVSLPMFNARRLRWHYRSRHESLIAFSNQTFYESNLVVFPSPSSNSDEFGIKFTHVKSGRFVNQHNIEEAKVIAEAVRQHLLHRSHESLGVVAMSAKQREQIERCVEELSKDDSMFRDALAENSDSEEALFLKNLENVQGDERDVIFISCTYGPQEAGAAQMPQRFGPINSAAGGRRLNVLFTRSKKRMHVFSSMTEGHIVASETSSPGVHALKNFLSFAQTGKLQQQKHTGKQPDSDFEISVMNALKLEGFNCVPQVGVAGYFIDLAVQDPGQPGRYLMGVECDGATYHSGKSARDRDRLRQSVLEGLGWNIKRIWSTDWFKNPQAQLKPIIEALHLLKTELPAYTVNAAEVDDIAAVINHEETVLHSTDRFSRSENTLAEKLQLFSDEVIQLSSVDIIMENQLLRPAMIAALCEFKPISKSDFLDVIPRYLRIATATDHGKFIDQVLNIIAEDEQDSSF